MKTARSSDHRNFYCTNGGLINERLLIKKKKTTKTKEMGRKNGSAFHLLWRLLWDSRGATGAEPCDVTACRASDKWALTRAIDKSKSWCLNFKDSLLFLFFFFFLAFRKAVVRQLFDAKQTDIWHSPCGDLRETNIRSSPPSGHPSSPPHTQGARRPLPSLPPHFSAGGSSPTSEGPVRRAACIALTNRPCLISPWYLTGNSL